MAPPRLSIQEMPDAACTMLSNPRRSASPYRGVTDDDHTGSTRGERERGEPEGVEGCRPVAERDDVSRREQFRSNRARPEGVARSSSAERLPCPASRCAATGRLRQPRRIDAQDIGAEQGERASPPARRSRG